ncbi:MAG: prepilin peptidase, partial [Candidatus Omnitrophica bacterium]|nr:prepilin peptidase [Candidatus Omnitrophota bacterium]
MSLFMFVFGAIVGSFLNVCIVRMPHEKSVVKPRSHCVHCKKQLLWYDNIPFVSYILLKGRCRFCGQKISPRYFLVELITAITFVGFYQYYGLTALLPAYLAMVSGFIVATFVDFEHRIIPDEISVGGMVAGLFFSAIIPGLHGISAGTGSVILAHLKSLGWSLFGV